jgi:hypothetical protein
MRSERFWIVLLALTAFAAGMAAGVLLALGQRPTQDAGAFPGYEARMIETFDLDTERVRNLRYILQDYQEKIEALKERNIESLDGELARLGRSHRDLVRTWVVPERHRQQFDLWAGGLPVAPSVQ